VHALLDATRLTIGAVAFFARAVAQANPPTRWDERPACPSGDTSRRRAPSSDEIGLSEDAVDWWNVARAPTSADFDTGFHAELRRSATHLARRVEHDARRVAARRIGVPARSGQTPSGRCSPSAVPSSRHRRHASAAKRRAATRLARDALRVGERLLELIAHASGFDANRASHANAQRPTPHVLARHTRYDANGAPFGDLSVA
jgi:hypothetical protein